MPHSRVVEQRYRLQPSDLHGPALATITNVSLQGLEEMRPVLHFDKFGKRLVLDDVQSDELARVTRSAVFADWVGCAVTLEAIDADGAVRIALSSPPSQPTPRPTRPRQKQIRRTQSERKRSEQKTMDLDRVRIVFQSLLLLLLVTLIAMSLYLLNNTEIIWRWLDALNASSG